MTLFDVLFLLLVTGIEVSLSLMVVLMRQTREDTQIQAWVTDALEGNVRYLAATLTTWHSKPAETPEEQAERDKDVADIQQRLNSPGPGLMQWDEVQAVRARYKK